MPAEADWKMRNPYSDKCLMNDFLAYEMFEQMGNYQCRRRFVEVFVNPTPGTKLTYANYYGVLVFLEKIETGKDRVNIAETDPREHQRAVHLRRLHVQARQGQRRRPGFHHHQRDGLQAARTEAQGNRGGVTNPQVQWLRKYISLYEAAVGAADWLTRTGTNHYSHYIDMDTFVDHHWICEFPKQIDGYRISNFFAKDRERQNQECPDLGLEPELRQRRLPGRRQNQRMVLYPIGRR